MSWVSTHIGAFVGIIIGSVVLLTILVVGIVMVVGGSDSTEKSPATVDNHIGDIGIQQQKEKSIQIVNDSETEDYIHVFIINDRNISQKNFVVDILSSTEKGSDGKVTKITDSSIEWGKGNKPAWDPLGAHMAYEVVIPKKHSVILRLGSGSTTSILPIRALDTSSPEFISTSTDPPNFIQPKQEITRIEQARDAVANISNARGFNYRVRLELTSDNQKILTGQVAANPCKDNQSTCVNPHILECGNEPTCLCISGTQSCCYNACSQKLFNVSQDFLCENNNYDNGEGGVKEFINKSSNIKKNTEFYSYVTKIQESKRDADFGSYAWDYDDVSAGFAYFRQPYKMKITIF